MIYSNQNVISITNTHIQLITYPQIMKPLIAIFLISTTVLSSCGSTVIESTKISKTPFLIDTYTIGQKQASVSIEKTGRITASSSLTLSAQ